MDSRMDRRHFLRAGALGAGVFVVGASACNNEQSFRTTLGDAPDNLLAAPPIKLVRIGFVGVGGMGTAHVRNLVRIPGCQITAVCDINSDHALRASAIITDAGFPRPTIYDVGETDFVRMCEVEDLDLVYNATPWRWHVPISLAAMRNGKHAATEVPAATTIDDCWRLVESAEKHKKHCVMMENCNYGRAELMVFNMARKGVLGEILHAECGYMHDLRAIKFSPEGEGLWRREHSKNRNANLYPTHGLGPVAQTMDINRGDRLDYLVSMSSPSRGLQEYAINNFPEGAPQRDETYVLGDVNTSIIKTAKGRTIIVGHDCNLPRPYSRINLVQGTKGIFQGYPDRVHLEGITEGHGWDDAEVHRDEYDHPLWKQLETAAEGAGHGGMDYLEDFRLIQCLRKGLPTDMNVYDAAVISAVTDLSETSVANNGMPVEFPDFTRGKWEVYPRVDLSPIPIEV